MTSISSLRMRPNAPRSLAVTKIILRSATPTSRIDGWSSSWMPPHVRTRRCGAVGRGASTSPTSFRSEAQDTSAPTDNTRVDLIDAERPLAWMKTMIVSEQSGSDVSLTRFATSTIPHRSVVVGARRCAGDGRPSTDGEKGADVFDGGGVLRPPEGGRGAETGGVAGVACSGGDSGNTVRSSPPRTRSGGESNSSPKSSQACTARGVSGARRASGCSRVAGGACRAETGAGGAALSPTGMIRDANWWR